MPERLPGRPAPAGTAARARAGVLAGAVVVGLLAAPLAPHTWPSTVVTGVVGLVAATAMISGRPSRVGSPRRLRWTAVGWFVVFVAVLVLELGALTHGDRPSFPTLSWLLGPYFVEPAARFGGYVVWLCAGWWLVRR